MGLYQNLEDEVIADIARRVKKTGRYTETAELMAKSMVEQGYSAEKIQAEVMKMLRADKAYQMAIAENTKAYKQEIQNIIDNTVREAKEAGNELVAEAGNMAWNNDLSMWQEHGVDLKKPNSMSQLLTAFQAQTAGQLKNLTRTMGFKNTTLGTTGVLNAYQREMDLALLKVATGAFSYDQAVNDCVHRLAQSGLRSVDYSSGRSYQLDTAARMSIRTGLSQLSGKIMEANLASSGQDLVITSQHIGSRPEHVPWQNKVFSYSGKSKKYPDFFKETGYGTSTGLKGVNCTHDFYPFWEGASIIPEDIKEPDPVNVNGKEYDYYHATQQQRKMERDIRATKREIEAQRAIGGSTTELQSKLRKQTADYKQFSADAGLKPKENRLRVVAGSSKLKGANVRKNVTRKAPNDIIKESKEKEIVLTIKSKPDLSKYKTIATNEVADWKKACGKSTAIQYKQIAKHSKADGTNGGYVRSHRAWEFNAEMREGKESLFDDDDKLTLNTVRELCRNNATDRAVILDRYVDSSYLSEYGEAFNRYREDLIDNAVDFVKNNLLYKDKTENSIVSASYASNVLTERDIHIRLHCDVGTHMFVTKNIRESEVLFHDGLTYEIVGVSKEEFRGKMLGSKQHRLVLEAVVKYDGLPK